MAFSSLCFYWLLLQDIARRYVWVTRINIPRSPQGRERSLLPCPLTSSHNKYIFPLLILLPFLSSSERMALSPCARVRFSRVCSRARTHIGVTTLKEICNETCKTYIYIYIIANGAGGKPPKRFITNAMWSGLASSARTLITPAANHESSIRRYHLLLLFSPCLLRCIPNKAAGCIGLTLYWHRLFRTIV